LNRLALILGAVLAAAGALAQQGVEDEIRKLDALRARALMKGDIPALDQMLSGNLVYTHASGWRQSKAELLASLRSGELLYRSFIINDVTVRPYGNIVMVTGTATAKVKAKGQELDVSLLFLEVYVRENGRWRLGAWESTRRAQ